MKLYQTVASHLTAYQDMIAHLRADQTPMLVVGAADIHKVHLIYAAAVELGRAVLVVCDDEAIARKMTEDCNSMAGGDEPFAYLYPARDFTFRAVETASREYEQLRIGVLSRILRGGCPVCFCSVDALIQHTIPPTQLQARSFSICANNSYKLADLTEQLLRAGYARRPQVDGMAQFSVRGGILDLFPPDAPSPVRVEFWGDEVDSIANFELDSQRRTDVLDQINITPALECLFDSPEALQSKIEALIKGVKSADAREKLQHDLSRLASGLDLLTQDKYLPLAYQTPATLLDYFADGVLFVSEYVALKERFRACNYQMEEDLQILFESGDLCKGLDAYTAPWHTMHDWFCTHSAVFLDTFARSSGDISYKQLLTMHPLQTSNFGGELRLLQEDIQPLLLDGYCVAVLAGSEKSAINLAHDLQKVGIDAEHSRDLKALSMRRVTVLSGNISAGFEYPEIKFALISTNRTHVIKTRKSNFKKGKMVRSLDDLTVGDAVVHVTHGIGLFDGIHKIDLHGIVKDYIKIKYAGADTLYVPVTQLDLVSKYIGPRDDGRIKLNKLNSTDWQKSKSRVRKACADMADELLALYAARMQVKGHAFADDTPWQAEFEERFEYTETDDQLRSISEIKQDMQQQAPMDRLLCGDVGFGKTEVALRAAFKCVTDSKQCALLCPTTILAWQHYQNATERFAGYPIRIELLSRFRTPKQIRESIQRIKTGETDLVIGTHRILQKDIEFHDLGLAIIDEEQRFGVKHKERFKEIFRGVDMLTLSATPIPRTLNMAMSGIRDMSTIEQPPQDRHPVQTYVLEYDNGIIADAIKKELRRGGQVYYIHNRVETIELCATKIRAMVGDVNIAVAHGQMNETELSDIWRRVMDQSVDILVCTTIIETGVDIKNANTLVIENADHMGLSQLYQLRGRVGRSNRRAFAYLTFQRGKVLTELSSKRLSAIREFTTFGSGFRIALRDLEIRGAGSILGGKQHGHMEAVGYDMYVQLLSEAIAQKKGVPYTPPAQDCLLDVQLDAHIPENYIENLSQRLDVYKKIASLKTDIDHMDLLDELFDRFGTPPQTVETLLDISLMRNQLAGKGLTEINQRGGQILLYPRQLDLVWSQALMAGMRGRVFVNASAKPYVAVKLQDGVVKTLQEICAITAALDG